MQEEHELRAQLERCQYIVDVIPEVHWVADREGRLIDFSPRWLELTGLTREQALTDGWTNVPHPDDLPAMLAAWTRARESGAPLDIEHRIRVAGGTYRWMRTRAFGRRDSGGKVVEWHGFTEEIDSRVRAEAALRASEARYRSVVETAQEGIWIVDVDYRTTFVNTRLAEMLGYSPNEMMGRPVQDFMDEEERLAMDRRRNERREGRSGHYDGKYVRKDGSYLWVIVSAAPITDERGAFAGALAMMADITLRKGWEIEQSRLAAIVESSEDAIVSKNLDGIVTSWNASAERLYGWKAEEIIGRSKALVIPPDLPNELSNILAQVRAGKRIQHYETRRIRKDGTIFDVAISVSPVKDGAGRITGAATIVRDITERRRTERALLEKHAEVGALNERLRRSMQETHHRVKNNLQIVCAMIDMQSIEHIEDETVPLRELERLGTHIRTLAIVHDILTKRVREDEHEQLLPASAVLGELIGLLEKTSGCRVIRAHVDDAELLSKQAVTLSLAINELVSNAAKHAPGDVELTFRVRGPLAEVTISDEGPGFPDGFDPQLHSHMGLELVLALVETDLKGRTDFEKNEQGGARVRIHFPLANGASSSELREN